MTVRHQERSRSSRTRASSTNPANGEAILAILSSTLEFRPIVDDPKFATTTSSWIVGAASRSARTWSFLKGAPARHRREFSWFVHEAAASSSVCNYLNRRAGNPVAIVLVFERAVECIEAAAPRQVLLADAVLAAEGASDTAEWLSPKEAAAELGFKSPNTIKNWIEKGYFSRIVESPGGHRKVAREDVDRIRRSSAAKDSWHAGRDLPVIATDRDLEELL